MKKGEFMGVGCRDWVIAVGLAVVLVIVLPELGVRGYGDFVRVLGLGVIVAVGGTLVVGKMIGRRK